MSLRKTCTTCEKKVMDNEFFAEAHWITKGHYPAGEHFTYPETSERWKKSGEERNAAKKKSDLPEEE